ncbi:serine carboxypeptidase S28-domain-containing protein [Lasiosphaeria miniovina]|uniref:Serine carboxypeptidase S28-domain-containing protein n=1 Tax=Lasiosphaeria miniovina TaxID=1954250 RepID=A0AA40EAR8_9PEZI|nr:serine carboxypeptidase S28-domain-containing protein [Lasiosphaeria miniovina]KAK0734689.1 serine carboxypeptidase S28-domain-containing protein [Lasiosphaeria miniovina]
MKLSPGVTLPFAAWIAPKTALRGAPEVAAASSDSSKGGPPPFFSKAEARPGVSCDWFTQPVDHDHPNGTLGTWTQQYCVSREWWAGPGSPVVIMTPGEVPMVGSVSPGLGYTFVDNTTMVGMYAQAIGAATVVLEHRFFGSSSPFDGMDSETLQYLTMEQAAADVVNFARTIVFPFDLNQSSVATKAPWVYWGASYSATLGSWIEHFHPGAFFAFHLSSATVEANSNNWYYYDAIREGINSKRNDTASVSGGCSLAFSNVVKFVDSFLLAPTRNATQVDALKQFFGATFPIEDDDFAYDTQAVQDDILGTIPGVVTNYAAYFKQNFRDSTCTYFDVWGQEDPLWCLNTHDLLNPFFEARTLGNPWRTWYWLLCNEPIASWATGAPAGKLSLVSRKIDSTYWQRQCEMHFPETNGQEYGSAMGKTPDTLNKATGGWLRNSTRVIYTTGEFDPWRSTTMSSEIRPGGPLKSSDNVAVFLIKNAQHGDEAFTARGLESSRTRINPYVQEVQDKSVEIMKKWISQYKAPTAGT